MGSREGLSMGRGIKRVQSGGVVFGEGYDSQERWSMKGSVKRGGL